MSKILILKIRKESFLNTVYNKLPWEDLLIGFQCKVLRNPNVYNVNLGTGKGASVLDLISVFEKTNGVAFKRHVLLFYENILYHHLL